MRTVKKTIFNLVELVERRASSEMARTHSTLLYDGWTSKTNTHHVALLASYCTDVATRREGRKKIVSVPRLSLLAMAPMEAEPSKYDGDGDVHAAFRESTK